MKAIAILLIVAYGITGCASNVNTIPVNSPSFAPLTVSAPVASIDALEDATAPGTSAVGAVLPLFAIPTIATNYGSLNLLAWGTKDGSGNIQSLQEINVYNTGAPANGVSLFFDTSSHLSSMVDQSTGYSFALSSPSAMQVTATLCDAGLNPVATITVTPDNNGNPQGQVVAGGTCTFANPFALALAPPGLTGSGAGIPTNLSVLPSLAQLITAASYVAGLGFGIAAIAKFKAHKDNPTQPVGSGIALLFVAAALIFTPSVFKAGGGTIFGNEPSVLGIGDIAAFATPP
jgi:hypothetical protein